MRFPLGVAQGYDEYGRWPNCGLVAVGFPWALPRPSLTMAVGQLGVGDRAISLGVAQGYVEYGRWPICV